MSNSQYDQVAPFYRSITAERAKYLAAVDECILQRLARPVGSFCDVGAADGVRGLNLASRMKAQSVFLCEPSQEMVLLCKQNVQASEYAETATIFHGTADQIPENVGPFDVMVCLWNVLGHMENSQARISALKRMASLLAPGGQIFLDVNNRHNAAAYGFGRVLWRRVLDGLCFDEKRGDANYLMHLPSGQVQGMGHLFTPPELKNICREAGLLIQDFFSIDYCTGMPCDSKFNGQLFMMLEKK